MNYRDAFWLLFGSLLGVLMTLAVIWGTGGQPSPSEQIGQGVVDSVGEGDPVEMLVEEPAVSSDDTAAEPAAATSTLAATATLEPTVIPTKPKGGSTVSNDGAVQLRVTIDRSAVPDLYYTAITLQTYVGQQVEVVAVTADGEALPFRYEPDTGIVQYTTAAADVQIDVRGELGGQEIGATEKLFLRDGKQWAWSHGFDDNMFLFEAIDLFKEKEWRGSVFLIGSLVDETRDEGWIVDKPAAHRLLADGWSLGSHGWLANCTDTDQASVDRSFAYFDELVASSPVPTYQVLNFAAPCFFDQYHPLVLAARENRSTEVLFNESQNRFYQILDASAAEITDEQRVAYPLDLDLPLGRDFSVEFEEPRTVQDNIDWAAEQAANGVPIWYNSGTHGKQENALAVMIDYVYDTYGPAGDDSVWVAPSDEIVSYALVREATVITIEVSELAE